MMRIIGGSAKGKNLFSPSEKTRPTSDRAREGLFSSLESEFGSMADIKFLDLFSGSGAVGVEALSRGAAVVISVEQHQITADLANKNFQLVNNATGSYQVISQDAEKYLSNLPNTEFDIIFLDPPYELSNTEIEKLLTAITEHKFLKINGVIAVERESRSKEFNWPAPLIGSKVRAYGQGSIYYGGYSDNFLP
jgi:16S rRNA (guanine966-N2)-methyltransferase